MQALLVKKNYKVKIKCRGSCELETLTTANVQKKEDCGKICIEVACYDGLREHQLQKA